MATSHAVSLEKPGNNESQNNMQRTHTKETFTFTARGTMSEVAPLFGADKERLWAPGWNPEFMYPVPSADEPGMVFAVEKSRQERSVWVNTEFDVANGRMQYAYMIPDLLVTVITLHLSPQGSNTRVDVTYERTALTSHTDARVQQMAIADRAAGLEWEAQINACLARMRK